MNINTIQIPIQSNLKHSGTLRTAAAAVPPPKLTDDEVQMIRNEFPKMKPMNLYTGQGSVRQEMIAGRGQRLDITI